MICNVCGDEVDVCVNCFQVLPHSFFCYEETHFCLKSCWEGWLINEAEGELRLAEQVQGKTLPEEEDEGEPFVGGTFHKEEDEPEFV